MGEWKQMIEEPHSDYPVPKSLHMLVDLVSLFVEVLLERDDVHERFFDVLLRGDLKDYFLAFRHLDVPLRRRDEAKSKDIVFP